MLDNNSRNSFNSTSNLKDNDIIYGKVSLLIDSDNKEEILRYLKNKFNIDKQNVLVNKLNLGYLEGNLSVPLLNFTPLLILLVVIFEIINIVRNRKSYLIMSINGVSNTKKYIYKNLKRYIYSICLLMLIYLISVFYIYFKYNFIIVSDYLLFNRLTMISTILLIFITVMIKFIIIFCEKIDVQYNKNPASLKLVFIYLIVNMVLSLFIHSSARIDNLQDAFRNDISK
ncbi:MAG: hypothetical protein ACK5NF_04290 [Bacilli bacterium]